MKKVYLYLFLFTTESVFAQETWIETYVFGDSSRGSIAYHGVHNNDSYYSFHLENIENEDVYTILRLNEEGIVIDSNRFDSDLSDVKVFPFPKILAEISNYVYYPITFEKENNYFEGIVKFDINSLSISNFTLFSERRCGKMQHISAYDGDKLICTCRPNNGNGGYTVLTMNEDFVLLDSLSSSLNLSGATFFVDRTAAGDFITIGQERINDSLYMFVDHFDDKLVREKRNYIKFSKDIGLMNAQGSIVSTYDHQNYSIMASYIVDFDTLSVRQLIPRMYSYSSSDRVVNWSQNLLPEFNNRLPRNQYLCSSRNDNGSIISAGTRWFQDSMNNISTLLHVFSMNEQGIMEWEHVHNILKFSNDTFGTVKIFDITASEKGIFLSGGATNNITNTTEAILIKLDKRGCLLDSCDFVLSSNDNSRLDEKPFTVTQSGNRVSIDSRNAMPYEVSILRVDGGRIRNARCTNECEIFINDLTPGIYFIVVLNNDGQQYSEQVVILN